MNAHCLDGCEPGQGEVRACVGHCLCREAARAAFNTMVEAWEGAGISPIPHWPGPHQEVVQVPSLILPLTETRDDE